MPISICITILAIYVCHPKEPILMFMLKVSHKSIVRHIREFYGSYKKGEMS